MEILEDSIDRVTVFGGIGTFATVTLGQWNFAVGIVTGVLTSIYLAIRIYQTLKKK